MRKQLVWFALIIILSLPAVWSLLHPGFFTSHDGEWMVIRFTDFHRALREGQFPVRFGGRLNHGYGYPVFNFLYPFPFYFAEVFYIFGLSFTASVKATFILSFFLSGVFMFLWTRNYWGNLGGLISALVYIYTPYRFLDVYVRGSLGEAVAFIFPPLIFWMIDRLRKKYSRRDLIIGALGIGALITSHNTMAMLFLGLILAYVLFLKPKLSLISYLLSVIFLGLSLSCFFWLPALFEKKYVIFDRVLVSNFFAHFPTLKQLLFPSWGYGPSLPLSDKDTLSFQIGVVNLAVVFLVTALVFKNSKFRKNEKTLFFGICFLLSIFLMTDYSYFFWRLFPIYNFIQFPWRLLSLTTFSSSFLAGALINPLPQKFKKTVTFLTVASLLILNRDYAKPESYVFKDDSFYATNEGTTTVADEYMPIWVKEPPQKRAEEKVEVLEGRLAIEELAVRSNRVSFLAKGEKEAVVRINTIYYPGWKVFVDGKTWNFDFKNKFGVIQFKVPKGDHNVLVVFKETPLRKTADAVSLISLGLCLTLFLKEYDKIKYLNQWRKNREDLSF